MDAIEVERLTVDALRSLGISASIELGRPGLGRDLRLDPGGTRVEIRYRTLIDHLIAGRLIDDRARRPGVVLLAVADRVTSQARQMLIEHGVGYYDLRGHLALRTDALVIDAEVEPLGRPHRSKEPVAGMAGLEVATALLMQPRAELGVRDLARQLDRAPSTVSESIRALAKAHLIDERHRVGDTRLFWQVSERWVTPKTYLATLPPTSVASSLHAPLRLGLERVEESTGWALTDSFAAVAFGAPLAVRTDQLRDFFVPDRATLQRAQKLLGTAQDPVDAAAAVRIAPVKAACNHRFEVAMFGNERWPLAHPLFVALDLAQDAGRGREVLEAWTPPTRWTRVW